jgi:hypothetical protein
VLEAVIACRPRPGTVTLTTIARSEIAGCEHPSSVTTALFARQEGVVADLSAAGRVSYQVAFAINTYPFRTGWPIRLRGGSREEGEHVKFAGLSRMAV